MTSLLTIVYLVIGAFSAITLHEYIKALVSHSLGDPLPKARGHLTLNPIKHFEPIGFICMILTGYGWGKPTPINTMYYKDGRKGTMLTYISPSVANLFVGTACSIAARLLYQYGILPGITSAEFLETQRFGISGTLIAYGLLMAIARANVALALFNIIPVYPLDGAKILALRLSPEQQVKMSAYEKLFQMILLITMYTGVVGLVLSPLQSVFVGR